MTIAGVLLGVWFCLVCGSVLFALIYVLSTADDDEDDDDEEATECTVCDGKICRPEVCDYCEINELHKPDLGGERG